MFDVCRQAFRVTAPITVRKSVVTGLTKLSKHEKWEPIVSALKCSDKTASVKNCRSF